MATTPRKNLQKEVLRQEADRREMAGKPASYEATRYGPKGAGSATENYSPRAAARVRQAEQTIAKRRGR